MFDPTQVPAREVLQPTQVERLRRSGALVTDDRRRRPLYFDGRFLAARDLTRDQTYFLTRQADLGRIRGGGVVEGLRVEPGDTATSLVIERGHGITPSGETVVLGSPLEADLADLPEIQRLDAAFGLLPIPRESGRSRTGLFVLALRPVEFTANPITAYPTEVTGERAVEDGDIVEATAVTLVPYPDSGSSDELAGRRARAAHAIFVRGGARGTAAGALPLAMVALDHGIVEWVDSHLVRREVGGRSGDLLGLGAGERMLREAHLRQYDDHLAAVLEARRAGGRGGRFAASEHFLSLPPVGRMPTGAVDPEDFSQIFFPPEVEAELSVVPRDELPALVEEALRLPPFDLSRGEDAPGSSSVLVLVPVSRPRLRSLGARLESVSRALRPGAPNLMARRTPRDLLSTLRLPRGRVPSREPESPSQAEWRALLDGDEPLWFVRRRNLAYRAELSGAVVEVRADEVEREEAVVERLGEIGLDERFRSFEERASVRAVSRTLSVLSGERFLESPVLMGGLVEELESREGTSAGDVIAVEERFSDPQLGEGLRLLEASDEAIREDERVVSNLARSGAVPELDRLARMVPAEERSALVEEVLEAADRSPRTGPRRVRELVEARMEELRQ